MKSLLRRPLLALGIIVTLGVAFSATLLVAGLLNSFLLRPLPYGNAERIVAINEFPLSSGPSSLWRMTFGNAADVYDRATTFSRKAIVRNESFTIRAPGGTEVAFVQRVTPEFFAMLGVRAAFGEIITPANAELGGERAIVLSNELWQRRFGGDRAVIGTSVQLDQGSYRIVGVMPADLVLPLIGEGQQAWVAMLPADFQRQERATRRHFMFGELAPGATPAAAQGELAALAAVMRKDFPDTNADKGLTAVTLRDALVGTFRRQLFILQAAVVLVLVVACVNAGCLLLAQAIRRRREFAVRLALGAATRDLLRQFFVESLWLSLGGATLGLLLAAWLSPMVMQLLPEGAPLRQLPPVAVTFSVVVVAILLALVIALIFSLVPLLQARRLNIETTLRDGSRQLGSVSGGAATRALVALQVAVALALLITAVQLVRSFNAVKETDRGIPVQQLQTFRLGTRGAAYASPEARVRYFQGVIDELRKQPHVAAGGTADFAFASVPASYLSFTQEGDGLEIGDSPKRAVRRAVSVGLLDALQLKIRTGRWISDDDRVDTRRVVVVSQSLAEKYWPDGDPVGRRVKIEGTNGAWWEVVGVASDILSHGPQPQVIDSFFLPHTQFTPLDTGIFIRLRDAQPLTKEQVDRAVTTIDPNSSPYLFLPAQTFYTASAWQTKFSLTLVGIFAGLAATLCLTGVYAVLAFAVAGRTSEFGVRLALGATRADVARLVLRDAARMTVPGLLAGIVLAALGGRAIGHLLYGVSPVDGISFAFTFLALAIACTIACIIPSLRATRIDPLRALRAE